MVRQTSGRRSDHTLPILPVGGEGAGEGVAMAPASGQEAEILPRLTDRQLLGPVLHERTVAIRLEPCPVVIF